MGKIKRVEEIVRAHPGRNILQICEIAGMPPTRESYWQVNSILRRLTKQGRVQVCEMNRPRTFYHHTNPRKNILVVPWK